MKAAVVEEGRVITTEKTGKGSVRNILYLNGKAT